MAFKKGDPKPPGSGRKKGTANRVTCAVKAFFVELVDDPQVQARLRQQILDGDTRAFFRAVEHVIGRPKESVEQSIVGPMEIRWLDDTLAKRLDEGRQRAAAARAQDGGSASSSRPK